MHKIFAKPLFLGKKVIFMTECHSTNDELMAQVKKGETLEGAIVYTDYQTSGKGQRGNVWVSEKGKNLLLSVLLKPHYLPVDKQYILNLAVGLGVLRCVEKMVKSGGVSLKWPNDVYINDKKIGGILIENIVKGKMLDSAVVGVGLNLNQAGFSNPRASSLFMETGIEINREEFIESLLLAFEYFLIKLRNGNEKGIVSDYYSHMYRKEVLANYRDREGDFKGTIKGINESGQLLIDKEGTLYEYGIKEVEFL